MVQAHLEDWDLAALRYLFIENVGNLVCPTSWDLGESLRVALVSVTEGEDKPLKYPGLFNTADVAVITKIDLAEACDFDRDLLRALADGRPVLELDLEAVTSNAIIATAGLQLRRRLDPDAASTDAASAEMRAALAVPEDEIEVALDAAAAEHRARIAALHRRRSDHPNLAIHTREGIDRQIVQATAAGLLWPIPGNRVSGLFGLASENAGQKRVSNYRKALADLLPVLSRLLDRLGRNAADTGEADA